MPAAPIARARRLRKAMTSMERRLWNELRKLDGHFRRQAPVGRYVADFASHGAKLVIEVDGGWHDLDEAKLDDALRTAWLESQGYRVLRFKNAEVMDELDAVVERVKAALSSPFPLDGGRAGDGGEARRAKSSRQRSISEREARPRLRRAATPIPALPPSEGEGSSSPRSKAGGAGSDD